MDPGSLNDQNFLMMYSLEIGDQEAARSYREGLAYINGQDWRLGWSDMLINHANGNASGVRESWNWMKPRLPISTTIIPAVAMLMLANGDLAEAREIYLEADPEWMNPEVWERLVDNDPTSACLIAWTLTQTGEETLGASLLDQTLAFMTTLPGLVEHADIWNAQFCYLAAGDTEKALTLIETQLAHNHLDSWNIYDQLPMYEQIRHEPRYQAAMTERERRLAIQREAVDQWIGDRLMSFFAELKRRNVFRVGIAYVVGAGYCCNSPMYFHNCLHLPEWLRVSCYWWLSASGPLFSPGPSNTPEGVKREKDVDRSQSITPKPARWTHHPDDDGLAIAYLLYDSSQPQPHNRGQNTYLNRLPVASHRHPREKCSPRSPRPS